MSAYTAVAANLLFPLHEMLKRHSSVKIRKALEKSQWMPAEAMREQQLQQLRLFLSECAEHVPYYRDLFQTLSFQPELMTSLDDLSRLPLLSKDIIRTESHRLCSKLPLPMQEFSTTGSTGDPLRFKVSSSRISHDVAAKWRATRWWGCDIGDREMVIWASPIELGKQDQIKRLRDWLLRSRLAPSSAMSMQDMDRLIADIRTFRPTMLFGYPSSMSLIAQRAEQLGIRLDNLGIKVVFCTAERLLPHQVDILQRVFGCPTANGYGGRDSGFIAHSCQHGGMHINADGIVVEVVDSQGKPLPAGVPGDVVITHLHSSGFPFVRYKNGDVAVLDDQPCPCGRNLPLLKDIRGRSNDMLQAEDGTMVHDVAIAMVMRDLPGLNGFKVIQESLRHCRLQLVTDALFLPARHEAPIREVFHRVLGRNVQLAIEYVGQIQAEPSGKYRYFVSKLGQQMQAPAYPDRLAGHCF